MALFTSPAPSQNSKKSRKFRTLSLQFGDGYKQDTPDGINYQIDTWDLVYENLDGATYSNVSAYFDSVGSFTTFTWTAPGDSTSKTWKVSPNGYQVNTLSGNVYTVSTTITQVF